LYKNKPEYFGDEKIVLKITLLIFAHKVLIDQNLVNEIFFHSEIDCYQNESIVFTPSDLTQNKDFKTETS